MASNIDEDLHGMCLDIVNEIEAAVAGNLYKTDNSEFKVIENMEEYLDDVYRVDDPKEQLPEQATVADIIEKRGLGDTRFEVDSEKELCGGKTLFAFGGPNIWVHDTGVYGYWGSTKVEIPFNEETRSAMFDWFNEQWKAIK